MTRGPDDSNTCLSYRLLQCSVIAASVAFLILIVFVLMVATFNHWNNSRIAPLIGFVHGYELYYPADQGPILNTIYPPLAYFAYLPAALFSDQNSIVRTGNFLAMVYYLLPLVWIGYSIRPPERQSRAVWGMGLVVVALLITVWVKPLYSSFGLIHADAPALALAGLACLTLGNGRNSWRLAAAGLLAAAAVWAKQTMVPILVALPLWLLLQRQPGQALRLVGWMACFGVLFLVVFLSIVPASVLWFNIWVIPGSHPWKGEPLGSLATAAWELMKHAWPFALFLAIGWKWGQPSQTEEPAANRWGLFLLTACFLIPTSMLGRVKVGGYPNVFSPCVYFLLLACLGFSVQHLLRFNHAESRGRALTLACINVLFLIWMIPRVYFIYVAWTQPELFQSKNAQQLAFERIRQAPGTVYFPSFPLTHLMAEGKLTHHDYALYDRLIAGQGPSGSHLWQFLPSKLQVICLSPQWNDESKHDDLENWGAANRKELWQRYLVDYREPETSDNLPGWKCYAKVPPAAK